METNKNKSSQFGERNRKIVLGLGNLLNRDEGVGVHALQALERSWPDGSTDIEFIDGGVLGMNLLTYVEEASHLLILDAVDAGKAPGEVIELLGTEVPLGGAVKMSQHQITFQEVLGMASIREKLPSYLYLIGIQPEDLSLGLELSPKIQFSLSQVVSRARAVIEQWN